MASFPIADEHRFAIILGAGAAGIIQGCTFLRENVFAADEFEILDRNPDFGGVWWKNTYPGAACDIASHIYSISWAPNPYWSQKFAPQEEILKYFKDVALQYGLDKCTTFETEILGATWDESQMLWMVETQNVQTGIKRLWSCHVLVGALGAFTVPKKADITGLDSFKGEEWHTVDWPKNANVKGKTVGIIGTGPSAAQLLPHIYPGVRQLIVYQRSPGHVLPRDNVDISPLTKWCFANVPFVLRIFRWFLLEKNAFIGRNLFVLGGWGQRLVLGMAQKHLEKQIKDEKLREKLQSKDVFGCKRPLSLDDYYPVFNNPNVELVTDPVIGLSEHSIVSKQSETGKVQEREVDVLIWGTGYKPVDFGLAVPTRGRTGQLISEKYQPELFSLYGISIDDFPNYFNFLGPNSSSFETSVMDLFELQAEYITQVASHLYDKNVGSYRYAVMPREERVRTWTLSLREGQAKLPPAVPECRSYYKSRIGHVYRYPYRYSGYKALIKKPDFKRDWVALRNRIGQKEVQILDIY